MAGRSWIVATLEQREALRGLAGSSDREEADRARAMLLSLEGWTSERIAAAFCAQQAPAAMDARQASSGETVAARTFIFRIFPLRRTVECDSIAVPAPGKAVMITGDEVWVTRCG